MSRKIIKLDEFGMYCCSGYDEDSLNLLIYDFLLKIKEEIGKPPTTTLLRKYGHHALLHHIYDYQEFLL